MVSWRGDAMPVGDLSVNADDHYLPYRRHLSVCYFRSSIIHSLPSTLGQKMAPITTASNDETHAALLDQLDMTTVSKPFRNPNWKPPQRRNKSLKQIIGEANRAQQSLLNTQQNSGATTPLAMTEGSATPNLLRANPAQSLQDLARPVLEKSARQSLNGSSFAIFNGPSVTYTSIAAAPSLKPKKKYCDITGLPAKYTDPKTGLFYHNAEVYKVVKALNTTQVQEYLAIRGANTVLK
nr:chromatin-remodeling complex subunit ies6 [Quercus suber]